MSRTHRRKSHKARTHKGRVEGECFYLANPLRGICPLSREESAIEHSEYIAHLTRCEKKHYRFRTGTMKEYTNQKVRSSKRQQLSQCMKSSDYENVDLSFPRKWLLKLKWRYA